VLLDPLAVGAGAVAVMQLGRVAIGDAGKLVESPARACTAGSRYSARNGANPGSARKRLVPRLSGSAGVTPGAPAREASGFAATAQSTRAPEARTTFPHFA
jgi:hypothetical protein